MDDYEEDSDVVCPACGACPVRYRSCSSCAGEGYVGMYEEDPLWYEPEDTEECEECHGLGYQRWCPECGADLTTAEMCAALNEQYAALAVARFLEDET